MSAFETRLYALCIAEMDAAVGLKARTDVTHVVASALAVTIAAQADGSPTASAILAEIIVDELPGMVAKRAALIRQPNEGRAQ
jgi:hypothetical protein